MKTENKQNLVKLKIPIFLALKQTLTLLNVHTH